MTRLLWHRFVLKHRPRLIRVRDPHSWDLHRIVECSCRARAWMV